MKKLIVAGVMALGFLSASAQTKIGYVNTDEVIAAMPETDKANKELQEFQESLVKQGEELEKEANELAQDMATITEKVEQTKKVKAIFL